jgi:hypothetical protein
MARRRTRITLMSVETFSLNKFILRVAGKMRWGDAVANSHRICWVSVLHYSKWADDLVETVISGLRHSFRNNSGSIENECYAV